MSLGVSLHDKGAGNSLSYAAGICLIVGGMVGTGWLLFGAASVSDDGSQLQAQRADDEEQGLPLPEAVTRQQVPALVETLETAARTGSASLEDPGSVDDAVEYLRETAASEGGPGGSDGLPRDGRVLWEQDVIRLRIVSG